MWDKIASEWAGAEDWRDTRKICQPAMGKRDFLTFALMFVKHSPLHRPNIAESRDTWACLTIPSRHERKVLVSNCVETTMWRTGDRWPLRDGRQVQRTNWRNSINAAFVVEEENYVSRGGKLTTTWSSSSENTVQRRTKWRIWELREKRRSQLKGVKNTGKWKAMEAKRDDGRSGCGFVIKAVDWE